MRKPDTRPATSEIATTAGSQGPLLETLVVQACPHGVWVLDSTGQTILTNASLRRMLGEERTQPEAVEPRERLVPGHEVRFTDALLTNSEQLTAKTELCFQTERGSLWALVDCVVLQSDQDGSRGHLVMLTDITARKALEHELYVVQQEVEKRVAAQMAELAQANERLRDLALRDALTGLPNRRAFDEHLAQQVSAARRYQTPLSMLLLDVDHFKLINDSHGHAVGDAMLGRLGQAVASTIRASDVAARIGGEEFAVLAQHTPLQGARVLAERLRDTIETTSAGVLGPEKRVTVSIGVAQLGDETGPELLARTDKALYQAKHGGRNCVRVAGEVEHPQRDVP